MHDLAITSTDYGSDDKSWLGSAHGFEAMPTITLKADDFLDVFTDGHVPSGVVLARETSTGLYVRYDPAYDADPVTAGIQSDGHDVAVGHLGETRQIKAGARIPAPILRHGQVIEANLPANHGLDDGAKADVVGRIDYR